MARILRSHLVHAGAYLTGSILFILGSVWFHPHYELRNETSGAWAFITGCLAFVVGTSLDLVGSRESWPPLTPSSPDRFRKAPPASLASDAEPWGPVCTASLYVTGSLIFTVGAVFFLPELFATYETTGCWTFIAGCICFLFAGVGDLAMMEGWPEPGRWHAVAISLFNLTGSALFIVGCYYFFPWVANFVRGANCFVVGSVCYLLSAICYSFVWAQKSRQTQCGVSEKLECFTTLGE